MAELAGTLGSRVEKWQWGRLHQLAFAHRLGAVPLLRPIFNVAGAPVGGSGVTVNATSYDRNAPGFGVVTGPVWRQVVDLGDIAGNSWDVVTPGQSGHPLSPHYDDQFALWRTGQYHPQLFSEAVLSGGRRLVLQPGK